MKILIADDHAIVRKGLIGLLKDEFFTAEIEEATNGADAIDMVRAQLWDLVILDISMPGRNGIETLKQLRSEGVKIPILVLSMLLEDVYAIRVLKAGASGYVNKDSATEELITAVHKVLSGKKYISASVSEKLSDAMMEEQTGGHEKLSDREIQVLQLLATGKTVSEIAVILSLSVNTISTYRARTLEKLGLHNTAELTLYAIDNKLV
jgi:DNA-binding NarL/FixJ family response regulator